MMQKAACSEFAISSQTHFLKYKHQQLTYTSQRMFIKQPIISWSEVTN